MPTISSDRVYVAQGTDIREGRITVTDSKLILNLILERRGDRSCSPRRVTFNKFLLPLGMFLDKVFDL